MRSLNLPHKVLRLLEGKDIERTKEKGNSMEPIIKSGQEHDLTPVSDIEQLKVGDIVYCKVAGKYYTHKVSAIDKPKNRVQISNNHGHVNGWTNISKVYGKVTKIH